MVIAVIDRLTAVPVIPLDMPTLPVGMAGAMIIVVMVVMRSGVRIVMIGVIKGGFNGMRLVGWASWPGAAIAPVPAAVTATNMERTTLVFRTFHCKCPVDVSMANQLCPPG
jgi:hypothetical protein